MKQTNLYFLLSIFSICSLHTSEFPIQSVITGTLPNEKLTAQHSKNITTNFDWNVTFLSGNKIAITKGTGTSYSKETLLLNTKIFQQNEIITEELIEHNQKTNKLIQHYQNNLQIGKNFLYNTKNKKIHTFASNILGICNTNEQNQNLLVFNQKNKELTTYALQKNEKFLKIENIKPERLATYPKNSPTIDYVTFSTTTRPLMLQVFICALHKLIAINKKIGNCYSKITPPLTSKFYISPDKKILYYSVSDDWNNDKIPSKIIIHKIETDKTKTDIIDISKEFYGLWDIIPEYELALVSSFGIPIRLLDLCTNEYIEVEGLEEINDFFNQKSIYAYCADLANDKHKQKNNSNAIINYSSHGEKIALLHVQNNYIDEYYQNNTEYITVGINLETFTVEFFDEYTQNSWYTPKYKKKWFEYLNTNTSKDILTFINIYTAEKKEFEYKTIEPINYNANIHDSFYIIQKENTENSKTITQAIHVPTLKTLTLNKKLNNKFLKSIDGSYVAEKNIFIVVTQGSSTNISINNIEMSFFLNDEIDENEIMPFQIDCIDGETCEIIKTIKCDTYKFIKNNDEETIGIAYQSYSNNPNNDGYNENEELKIIRFFEDEKSTLETIKEIVNFPTGLLSGFIPNYWFK